jgi:hypothetical protein
MRRGVGVTIEKDARISEAVDLISTYGMFDGAHHKQWVLDQVVRALLGDPGYEEWVTAFNDPDENYCDWDTGVAP